MNSVLQRVMDRFRRRGQPSCEEVNGFIADYLDGALSEDLAGKYEAHIEKCIACGAYFEQYKQTMELARKCRDCDIPDDLIEHTLSFLRQRRTQA